MKERPILFQGAMVRALLDGSKTQTRRVVKDLPPWEITEICSDAGGTGKWMPNGPSPSGRGMSAGHWRDCPYGRPGDRLWVRETFLAYGRWETRYSEKKKRDEWHFIDMTLECDRIYQYAADNPDVPLAKGRGGTPGWWTRPAIFMPRHACRIQRDIVSVRAERLNDCNAADAMAEGCTKNHNGYYWGGPHPVSGTKQMATARKAYCDLWESINGAGSWDVNPFVWAITFKRVTP
jgi:hypothetical protein